MRSTVIAGLAVTVAASAAAGVACDDATLQSARAAGPKSRPNPTGSVLGRDCVTCTREQIGAPGWEPGRVVLFSGNVGRAGENRRSLVQSIFEPRHQVDLDVDLFTSALPHPPPYRDEIYDILDARGITPAQAFADVQFSAPQGVVAAVTFIPSAGAPELGSSDFSSGPVIPAAAFPLSIDWALYRDGSLVEPGIFTIIGNSVPPLSGGVSHFFFTFPAHSRLANLAQPPDGDYEIQMVLFDATGGGWQVHLPFKVGKGGVPPMPGKVTLTPDATGWFDGNNAAGVRGGWWATGDFYGPDGTPGQGACGTAGFQPPFCSVIATPPLNAPFPPDPDGRGMCTAGVVGQVPIGGDGLPAWSTTWGTIVGFNLAADDSGAAGPYDPIARTYTGFAFDVDELPPGGHMRVELATVSTNNNAAYWFGRELDVSPVMVGHNEIRWGEVGGPMYLGPNAPPFDPTTLTAIRFHVVPNTFETIPYRFCIDNTAFLTD